MFIDALFLIFKDWGKTQIQILFTGDKWLNKLWYTHTMGYNKKKKRKKEQLIQTNSCINL